MERREFDPEEYDVLIGHYLQAHNGAYISDRYVAFDEFPGDSYFFEPAHNQATHAVSNYLEETDTLPFNDWGEARYYQGYAEHADAIQEWESELNTNYHRDTRVRLQEDSRYHANAPLLTYSALEIERLDNGWWYAELDSGAVTVLSPEDEWTLHIPPTLCAAESVIALDGTPTIEKWELALGVDSMPHDEVLESNREKREYLQDVLELRIIRTDSGTKPYGGGDHIRPELDGALLEGICEREGKLASVISSKKAIAEYKKAGVDEYINKSDYYQNFKGMENFGTIRLGAVIGNPHPPEDETVERWAALDGKPVERKENEDGPALKGNDLDFGSFGNKLFEDVTEKEVLQAAMRFGRREKNGEKGATVYIHTSRLPSWVEPDSRVTVHTRSNGMEQVIAALEELDKWPEEEVTNKDIDIQEQVSVTNKQVCELMKELDEKEYVAHRRGGRGNAYHWSDVCLNKMEEHGRIEPIE
jgi:hypothetical protein